MKFKDSEEDRKKYQIVDEMVKLLMSGCSEEEFNKLVCPFCSKKLIFSVSFMLDGFSIRCTENYHFYRAENIENPPEWWKKYISYNMTYCP